MQFKTLPAAALYRAEIDLANKVREVPLGSNRGPRVEQMQSAAGCGPGDPWCCAADVCWYKEGAAALGMTSPLPVTGYCPAMVSWGRAHGRLVPATHAAPGDPVFYWNDALGRFAHAGLCRLNRGDGTIVAIEGNTNDTGAREGDGVYQKVRQVAGTNHVAIRMQDIGVNVSW